MRGSMPCKGNGWARYKNSVVVLRKARVTFAGRLVNMLVVAYLIAEIEAGGGEHNHKATKLDKADVLEWNAVVSWTACRGCRDNQAGGTCETLTGSDVNWRREVS